MLLALVFPVLFVDLLLLHLDILIRVLHSHLVLSPDGVHQRFLLAEHLNKCFCRHFTELDFIGHVFLREDERVSLQDDVLLYVVLLRAMRLNRICSSSNVVLLEHAFRVDERLINDSLLRLVSQQMLFQQEALCILMGIVRLFHLLDRATLTLILRHLP